MMPRSKVILLAMAVACAVGDPVLAQGTDRLEAPLGKAKLRTGKGKLSFSGKWQGEAPAANPLDQLSSVQVTNFGGAETGLVALERGMWEALTKNKGYRYADKTGSAAGIRKIVVKNTRSGGKLTVKARDSAVWDLDGAGVESLVMNLRIGDAKWCADLTSVKVAKNGRIKATGKAFPAECPCMVFDSTWAAVQNIFDRNGCTSAACHGAAASGGLDLRPDVAYANLVNELADDGLNKRVQPGSRQDSFLWQKLAAATEGYDLEGRGAPMPSGLPPISAAELEAIRLWIQFGANETGVVEGTEEVLGACLPPARPPTIEAPAPPPAGEGVQLHVPPWTIPPASEGGPNGEGEVCYAVYFDFRDQIPADVKTPCPDFWGGPTRECFYFNKTELTQTPNSHHSILHIYKGDYDLSWTNEAGTRGFLFECHGGASDGETCDPRDADPCGDEGLCYGRAVSSLACIGYGPPDYSRGFSAGGAGGSDNAPTVGGSQQPFLLNENPPGVFGVYPTDGTLVANSHAFNLFDEPADNEQWWNIYFATAEDRLFPMHAIFDATDIFVQLVPPFEEREYCRTLTMPQGSRVFELSSHTHEFGRLFRTWGPGIAERCRSTSAEPEACLPEDGPPIFVTTEYNDPTVLRLVGDDIHVLDSPDPADRRYKFCAIYDNGFTDPAAVKRNSTSPTPPQFGNLAPGGKCYYRGLGGDFVDVGIACLSGPNRGLPCGGDDSVCDSAPGAGDGICDACPLRGGVTTKDEMFILIGSFHCEPGTDCERGICVDGPDIGTPCDGDDSVCAQSTCGPYSN